MEFAVDEALEAAADPSKPWLTSLSGFAKVLCACECGTVRIAKRRCWLTVPWTSEMTTWRSTSADAGQLAAGTPCSQNPVVCLGESEVSWAPARQCWAACVLPLVGDGLAGCKL